MEKTRFRALFASLIRCITGHAALLSRISEEFGSDTVCVMSGNFVQRGEAAVLDKWSRTRLALQNGAALVMELPLPWAVAGAEKFALGGISLINGSRVA